MWPIRSNGLPCFVSPPLEPTRVCQTPRPALAVKQSRSMKWRRIPSIFRIPSMTVPKAFIDPNLQVSGSIEDCGLGKNA